MNIGELLALIVREIGNFQTNIWWKFICDNTKHCVLAYLFLFTVAALYPFKDGKEKTNLFIEMDGVIVIFCFFLGVLICILPLALSMTLGLGTSFGLAFGVRFVIEKSVPVLTKIMTS